MRHRLSGLSTYKLDGHRKGYDHPTDAACRAWHFLHLSTLYVLSVCVCLQMMLADGPGSSSTLPVIKLPYSSTACSLMSLLSAILSTLSLSDAEKRHSSSGVAAVALTDTVASQTTDIVRSCMSRSLLVQVTRLCCFYSCENY